MNNIELIKGKSYMVKHRGGLKAVRRVYKGDEVGVLMSSSNPLCVVVLLFFTRFTGRTICFDFDSEEFPFFFADYTDSFPFHTS